MGQIKIGRMVIGGYGTNCYLVYREGDKKVILIDPADQGKSIYQTLKEKGFEVAAILLTHAHFDHILGASELRQCTGAKLYALDKEQPLCESTELNLSQQVGRPCTIKPNLYVTDGEELTLADMTCKVLSTPGHTPGSCCYYFEEGGFVVCGDTVFQESVGRTDFPNGSSSDLIRSIREKIFTLPGETVLYPGHGDSTTVSHEQQYNPFC